MVEVRRALLDEIEAIVEIGKRGHADSENRRYEFDEGRAKLLVAHCVTSKRAIALVAIQDARIVGFLLGKEDEYGYIAMRYATDLAVYSEVPGAGRKLIERFQKWAFDDRKVDQMILAVSHGGKSAKATGALYNRLGYQHVGGLFTKQRQA
jgi:hypothetical protein